MFVLVLGLGFKNLSFFFCPHFSSSVQVQWSSGLDSGLHSRPVNNIYIGRLKIDLCQFWNMFRVFGSKVWWTTKTHFGCWLVDFFFLICSSYFSPTFKFIETSPKCVLPTLYFFFLWFVTSLWVKTILSSQTKNILSVLPLSSFLQISDFLFLFLWTFWKSVSTLLKNYNESGECKIDLFPILQDFCFVKWVYFCKATKR